MKTSPRFKAIIFDMDGTITVPIFDFDMIREELGISAGGDIVQEINSWPEDRQLTAWSHIAKYERKVLDATQFQLGAKETLIRFQQSGLFIGILTRNSTQNATVVLDMLGVVFDAVITRDYPYIKPDPRPLQHILKGWQIAPQDALMIGDYIDDIECGNAAGTSSCFFKNPKIEASYEAHSDFCVKSFHELERLVFDGLDAAL